MSAGTRFPRTARLRVPTVLQMEAVECGAACLGMILAHHGKWVPLEELRAACGVSRDGSRARAIVHAARSYGLDAAGWRSETAQVDGQRLPAILFWDFNHFVVLEGIGRDRVHLNDPACGPRTVTHEEFDRSFTGVMLTMVPGPGFRPSGSRPGVWRAVAGQLAGAKGAVAFLVTAGIAALLPGLVAPAALRIFVDDILIRGLTDWLRPLLLVLAVAAALGGLLAWLQGIVLARLQWTLGTSLGLRLTWHLLHLSPGFFAQRHAGDVASRLHAAEHACDLIGSQVAALFVGGLATVFYGGLMLLYDPVLAAIGLALALLDLAFVRVVAERQTDALRRVMREQAMLGSLSINAIQSIETLKAAAAETAVLARWSGAQVRMMNAVTRSERSLQRLGLVPAALAAVATAGILAVGGLRVMDGILTVGTLAAFQTVLTSFLTQVNGLVGVAARMRELRVALERVDDVLRAPRDARAVQAQDPAQDPAQNPAGAGAARLAGAVAVRGLTYGFDPLDPPRIADVSFAVAPGARIALVGPSGSGKTTLARLIVGLAEPWSGSIRFDGIESRALDPGVRCASVGYVDQTTTLIEGSVRDNLTLWDERLPDDSLIAAARDALLHEVVASRPGGYDGPVSEGGGNWSGGQAQRLEIARALALDPSILVLDEATSALDAVSEVAILENLRRRGCTTILVTHRLSAIRDCDEILVLDGGRIVQRGRHDALWNEPGPYAELIRAA
ncbi:NHLP family bacteriocin export ABC transporter peptidase/permease/ATPase subunit [Methylobacterium oryzihabitans]|uniref:NHLP family bacteriocin export ABC transporter peptidase/permease/ATPase subunit n=1 Tax=Methylobacterium oryzihabitans TaxID=2499852 RepID=A0A437NYI1_9HYPH|nr:NHLP family bacteriocin export ABC transporter peptidase/permease/ATPase subunit [Methylobacterium oryzihabitans]RVU14978.1 NHLP family bacteriocin export ABC transporter peptidase/permease/ATPase subunit [Methylobacterium oryzihabitans]